MDNYKEVDMDETEITLTKKEFLDTVREVAVGLITNPPSVLDGDSKVAFTLALSVPLIGDLIANELFGKEK